MGRKTRGREISGWVNLDKHDTYSVDVVHDLEGVPYPFADDSCHEILMNHVLGVSTKFRNFQNFSILVKH